MRLPLRFSLMFCAATLGFGLTSATAQRVSETDFLSGIEDFRNVKNMLPEYVNAQAKALLAERARKIQGFTSPQQVAERKAYIRARMMETLGGAFPERTPLNARTVGVIEREGYKIEKVIFESQPRFYVTASLYVPTRGRAPYPAILFPLGHEEGAKAHDTWQQVLGSFAQKGYVALAWDQIGQGERVQMYDTDFGESKVRHSTTEHTILGIQCLLTGDNLARYTIWDGMRALDYLLSRPEVDATRIGLTGNSGGGTHTSYLAALEDRIHVAAPSCFITSWTALLDTIGPQDAEQNLVPWIGAGLDHGDFIYAFAPKPFLMLSAIRDFFSISGARSTYREAQGVYKLMGVPDKVSMVEADDGHGYSKPRRLASYRWFGRWLKGVDDQEPEPNVVLATEEELFCTESGQVTVSLGGETVFTLNQKRAEQLRPKSRPFAPEELRNRLPSLTAYEAPKNALVVKPYGEIARAGYRIEKLVYESEPGIHIPALLFVPEGGSVRKPAMIYVHGRGKSAAAAAGGEIEQFVKAGVIVLAIDVRGLGETRSRNTEGNDDFPVYFGDFESAMTALHIGRPLMGMRMTDVLRGVDLLAARLDVERAKIYGFGKDAGAIPLLHAAAMDDRISKIALEGMLASYQTIIQQRIHRQIFEQVIPGVLRSYDLPDVVTAIAPRQVWIVNGVNALGQQMRLAEVKKQYATAASLHVVERRAADKPEVFYRNLINQE
ncbi:MAG: acetylxylan esterase [Blastocatellia bacterium]|nr:acetylxylan esterase [Blastocatellia bacterium]